jgi:hypothetical protein
MDNRNFSEADSRSGDQEILLFWENRKFTTVFIRAIRQSLFWPVHSPNAFYDNSVEYYHTSTPPSFQFFIPSDFRTEILYELLSSLWLLHHFQIWLSYVWSS